MLLFMLNQRKACHIFSPADKVESVWAHIYEESEAEDTKDGTKIVEFSTEAALKKPLLPKRELVGTFVKMWQATPWGGVLNTHTVDTARCGVNDDVTTNKHVCLVRFSWVQFFPLCFREALKDDTNVSASLSKSCFFSFLTKM